MPYKLTVTLDGKECRLQNAGTCDYHLLPKKFQLVNAIYPVDQGYDITVSRVGSKYRPYNREEFGELIGRYSAMDLLVFFFYTEEYEAFVAKKRLIDPRDLDGQEFCFHLDCYKNVKQVIKYPRHYHILELEGTSEKYLFPTLSAPRSNFLEDLELRLYFCHLSDY